MNSRDIIKTKRIKLGLTLEQLGEMVGVSKSTVRKWETGYIANMRRDKIAKLADALQVKPTELINNTEDEWDATLSTDETILIAEYNKLNELGKQTAIERVRELTKNEDYKDPTADVKFVGGEPIVKSTEKNRPLKEQTDDEYIVPIAARSGDKPVIKTSRTKIEEDAEKLPISDEEL